MPAKMVLASYIVRIYRFEKHKPHNLVGVVEEPGSKGKRAFTSLAELWGIISSSRGVRSNSKAKRNKLVALQAPLKPQYKVPPSKPGGVFDQN